MRNAAGARTTYTCDGENRITRLEQPGSPAVMSFTYMFHSETSGLKRGGLALDSFEGLRKGGASGPAVIPGEPNESVLIRGVRYTDSIGRVQATIDALNNYTTNVFDNVNRISATIDPLDNRTTQGYDAASRPIATVDANSNRSTTVYDSLNRVSSREDPVGNRTTYAYDAAGRQVSVQDSSYKDNAMTPIIRQLVVIAFAGVQMNVKSPSGPLGGSQHPRTDNKSMSDVSADQILRKWEYPKMTTSADFGFFKGSAIRGRLYTSRDGMDKIWPFYEQKVGVKNTLLRNPLGSGVTGGLDGNFFVGYDKRVSVQSGVFVKRLEKQTVSVFLSRGDHEGTTYVTIVVEDRMQDSVSTRSNTRPHKSKAKPPTSAKYVK